MPKQQEAARKAVRLDETNAESHVHMAYNYAFYQFDWPAAEREFKRAMQLDATNVFAHETYTWFLMALGRTEEALQEARTAERLDPVSAENTGVAAQMFYYARRYDEAIAECNRSLDLDPHYPDSLWLLGVCMGSRAASPRRPPVK